MFANLSAHLRGKVYQTEHYNLSMIISVGFRVKAKRGVEFRRWASHFHVIYPHNDSSQK
ncbi:RhuM family protein [Bacteroides fragilis]